MQNQKYKYLILEIDNSRATIRLNRAPDNSMNNEMMKEITDIHTKLNNNENIKAIILTSAIPGYLSNGLDIDNLLAADSKEKLEIFGNIYDMSKSVYTSPKLHLTYLNGHAIAGGAVLAAMSDFRFFLDGPYRIGFSEAKIGLGLPKVFLNIIKSIVGLQELKYTALLGQAYKPGEALQIGLVDELLNSEEAAAEIQKFISRTLLIPAQSYQAIKYAMREENIHLFHTQKQATLNWFEKFFNETLAEGLLATREKRRPRF